MPSKYIRVYYFNLKCTKKDESGNIIDVKFEINDYLYDINQKNLLERIQDIKNDKSRLDNFGLLKYQDKEYHSLVFDRLSEINTLRKTTLEKSSEGIELDDDEFIDKECSVLYDNEFGIMALQNNVGALTYKGIAEYLGKTYKDGEYSFELIPILAPKVVDQIKSKKVFRRIKIKLDNITKDSVLKEESKSSVLITTFRSCQDTGARTGTIDLSMSYDRKNTLDADMIVELVDDLELNKEYIGNAEFIMRKEDTDEDDMTVLNFLQVNLADIINIEIEPRKPLASSYILSQMIKKMFLRSDYLCQEKVGQ